MMTSIRRTECICFPRSGHTLLNQLLQAYSHEGDLEYCVIGDGTDRTFDTVESANFQKNHDFGLAAPIRDDAQYLVQVRYPIESLVSWFRMRCDKGASEDTPEAWTKFAVEQTAFWMGFYRKWIMTDVPRRFILNYADLVARPVESLTSVLEFLSDETVDQERVAAVCAAADVSRRHQVRTFKYYGPHFFGLLRSLFTAVPGVDVQAETLTIPASCPAPLECV